jgi:hypothetical protein
VQWGLTQVEEAELEPPHIPHKGGFVEGPDCAARNMGSQVSRQWPGESQCQQCIQGKYDDVWAVSFHRPVILHVTV